MLLVRVWHWWSWQAKRSNAERSGLSDSCGQTKMGPGSGVYEEGAELMLQRLERIYQAHASALADFSQECVGGVLVGLGRIGRIGPNRVIDDLGGFLEVEVQCGLADIEAFLQAIMTGPADLSVGRAALVPAERANGISCVHDLVVNFLKLRLE